MHRWCNSCRQLVDCLDHRVIEIVQPLPLQSPVERGTDTSTGHSKFDEIYLIDNRVLGPFHPATVRRRLGENSL